jgi:hypothetical protein
MTYRLLAAHVVKLALQQWFHSRVLHISFASLDASAGLSGWTYLCSYIKARQFKDSETVC